MRIEVDLTITDAGEDETLQAVKDFKEEIYQACQALSERLGASRPQFCRLAERKDTVRHTITTRS